MFEIVKVNRINCVPKLPHQVFLYRVQISPNITRKKWGGIEELKYVSEVTQRMTKTVDKALNYSRTTLHEAYRAIEQNAAIIQNHARDRFEAELKKYQEQLDAIHKKAVDTGQNISQCLKYKEEFENIPRVAVEELKVSINSILSESRRIVDEALSNVHKVNRELPNLKETFRSCGQEPNPVNCIERTVVRVINKRVKYIKKDVGAAAIVLSASNVKLHKVLKEKTSRVGQLAMDNISQFVNCINMRSTKPSAK